MVTRASDEEGPPEPAGQGRGGGRAWPSLDASSCGLALAAAAGVLMLQGSQQALAGTEFMGMQDVVGDLGDISTGFASVRRTASTTLSVLRSCLSSVTVFCVDVVHCIPNLHFRLFC